MDIVAFEKFLVLCEELACEMDNRTAVETKGRRARRLELNHQFRTLMVVWENRRWVRESGIRQPYVILDQLFYGDTINDRVPYDELARHTHGAKEHRINKSHKKWLRKHYQNQNRADVRSALACGDWDRASQEKNHRGRMAWDLD